MRSRRFSGCSVPKAQVRQNVGVIKTSNVNISRRPSNMPTTDTHFAMSLRSMNPEATPPRPGPRLLSVAATALAPYFEVARAELLFRGEGRTASVEVRRTNPTSSCRISALSAARFSFCDCL